jgi:4'-phosphopantetheinyl transferase EntD
MFMEYKTVDKSRIGVAPIIENSESLLTQLDNKDWYLPFIEKMSEYRRREWLAVRVLLKKMLNEEKEILYFSSGKPYLSDDSYQIGISHTKYRKTNLQEASGYVALILNKEKDVSIDIEQISSRVKNISSRFISEAEEKAISKENELIHLLLHWSAKESIFKILATENIDFKTQLHLAPFEPVIGTWSNFQAHETRTGKQNRFTVNYFVQNEYVLTYI